MQRYLEVEHAFLNEYLTHFLHSVYKQLLNILGVTAKGKYDQAQ